MTQHPSGSREGPPEVGQLAAVEGSGPGAHPGAGKERFSWGPSEFTIEKSTLDTFHREVERLGAGGLSVLFLSFLKQLSRFGYFSFGPITIDVRLIEDIVDATVEPSEVQPPALGDDVARFFDVLMNEVRRSGRSRIDDLHFLLAFMRCGEGLPARVFGELGITPEQVEDFARRGPAASETDRLYSPEEAAAYLGVHVQTVRGWIRSGRLRASRLAGQRALRIRASDLLSVLEPVQPGDPL